MIDWLLAPLQYEFMVRGLLAAVIFILPQEAFRLPKKCSVI